MVAVAQTQTGFDYAKLPKDTAKWLKERTGAIRFVARRGAEETLRLGQFFREVQKRLGHGNWIDWLETETAYSPRSARRIVQVARDFAGHEQHIAQFDASALYVLTQPNCPSEARALALQLARDGKKITHSKAAEIFAACRPPVVTAADLKAVRDARRAVGLESSVAAPAAHPGYDALTAVVEASRSVQIVRGEDLETNETQYHVTVTGPAGVATHAGDALAEVLQQAAGTEPRKYCRKCGSERPLYSCFSHNRTKADGRSSACKSCEARRSRGVGQG